MPSSGVLPAYSDNSILKFLEDLSVPSSRVKDSWISQGSADLTDFAAAA